MQAEDCPPLVGLLADILEVPDVLFVVKSGAAVAEIRSNSLAVSYKNGWITIGDNDGPAHMHVNYPGVSSVRFVVEEKPRRTSYSVQFMTDSGERILAAFFTKMYDPQMMIIPERLCLYSALQEKWSDITL